MLHLADAIEAMLSKTITVRGKLFNLLFAKTVIKLDKVLFERRTTVMRGHFHVTPAYLSNVYHQ